MTKSTLNKTSPRPDISTKKETVLEKKPNMMSNLTDEERHLYGDRFPLEYMKLDFLGRYHLFIYLNCRGGFALVWLGASKKSAKKYAVKQILKNHLDESQSKELKYGRMFFENGGIPREKFKMHPGINL